MPAFNLSAFVPYQLAVAAARVSRELSETYRAEGISIPEWRVLAHLAQDGAVSVRDIHLRVNMDKSKVSRAATRLEKSGLVAKQAHAGDKRLVSLTLTPAGQALFGRLVPKALDYEADLLNALGPDAAAFCAALAHISEPDNAAL